MGSGSKDQTRFSMNEMQDARQKTQRARYRMKNRICLLYCLLCLLIFLCSVAVAIAENESTQDSPDPAAWEKWAGLRVIAVEYQCDGPFSENEVALATTVKAGSIYSRSEIRQSLERIYSLGRFSNIKVDAQKSGQGVILTFNLTRKIKIGQINLKGNKKLNQDAILRVMKLKLNQEYRESLAEADIESIKELYKSFGYFSTDISFESNIDEREKLANITFTISEGVQTRVAEIIFIGTVEAALRPKGTETLLDAMKNVKRGKIYRGQRSLDSDKKEIENEYKNNGYITAKVVNTHVLSDPEAIKQYRDRGRSFTANKFEESDLKGGKVAVIIEIKQGKRVDIKIIEDEKKEKDGKIRKSTAVWRMGSVSAPVLRRSAADIENLYRLKGYYKAKVDTQVLNDKPESTTIIFKVTKNRMMRIGKISITGVDGAALTVDVERIKKQMLTRTRHPLSIWLLKKYFPHGIFDDTIFEMDKRAIIAFYKNEGYSNARIHDANVLVNEKTGRINIKIEIFEGPKTNVTEIILEGNHKDAMSSEEILFQLASKGIIPKFNKNNLTVEAYAVDPPRSRYKLDPPGIFREEELVAARSYLRLQYADKGYFAQIEPVKAFNEDNTEVVITYKIIEGKRIRIDDHIEINGNTRTKRWVIERELSDTLTVQRVFNRTEIEKSWQRLLDLGIFENVRIDAKPILGFDDLYRLTVDVKDRKAISVNMNLGSSSSEYFRVGVEANHINLWGTSRRARFTAGIGTKGSRGEFDYSEPRILGTRVIGLANLHRYPKVYRYSEESYAETWNGGKLGLSQKFHRVNTLLYQYGYDLVEYEDVAGKSKTTIGEVEAIFQRDRRNNPLNPTKGWFHTISLEYADTWLGGTESFAKFSINSDNYMEIVRGVVLALGARTGYSWELDGVDRTEPGRFRPEQFKQRDYRTPRGFQWTAADAGNTIFNVSTELRFPVYKWIGAAVFFDSGLSADRRDFNFRNMNSSVGLGLRFITPVGPIRVDYGYPVNGNADRYKWPHIAFGHAF